MLSKTHFNEILNILKKEKQVCILARHKVKEKYINTFWNLENCPNPESYITDTYSDDINYLIKVLKETATIVWIWSQKNQMWASINGSNNSNIW